MNEDYRNARVVRTGKSSMKEIPDLIELEDRMTQCQDQLEELVDEMKPIMKKAAKATSDWLRHKSRQIMILDSQKERSNEDYREAFVLTQKNDDGILGIDLHDAYLIAKAEEKALDGSLKALQSSLTGYQSKAKSVRQMTGLE